MSGSSCWPEHRRAVGSKFCSHRHVYSYLAALFAHSPAPQTPRHAFTPALFPDCNRMQDFYPLSAAHASHVSIDTFTAAVLQLHQLACGRERLRLVLAATCQYR